MNKIFPFLIMAVTLCILTTCTKSSQEPYSGNWPNFRGVNCSGIASPGEKPPLDFSPKHNVIWQLPLPGGHSSPCIWGNNIFITGFDEDNKLMKMFCIDRKRGKIKWVREISADSLEKVNPLSSPATATPATDGEAVFFYFSSYGLLCYDFLGELKWELRIPVPRSRHGMGTSPIVTDNMVILNCLGHLDDPRVLAINKADGSTIWKYSLHQENYSGDSYSTPVIYKNQVIIYGSKDVSGYDLNTGLRVWYFDIGVTDAVCTPVLGNGIIYTTAHSTYGNPDMRAQFPDFKEIIRKYDLNNDYRVNRPEVKDYQFLTYPEKPEISDTFTIADAFPTWDKNNDGFIDSLEWKVIDKYLASFFEKQGLKAIRLGGEGDISLSSFLWGNHDQVPHVSSPLFYNNHVYMIRDGGIISCFDSERGNILFRARPCHPGNRQK